MAEPDGGLSGRAVFRGHYYDGRSADRRPVAVAIGPAGLTLVPDAGPAVVWPFEEVRQTQGANPGEPARFERGGPLPEILVLADREVLVAIAAAAPGMRRRVAPPPSGRRRAAIVLGALGGTVAAAALLYLRVIPFAAEAAARHVPITWEEEIGRQVVEEGLAAEGRCTAEAGRAALDRLVRTLLAASPGSGYTYRVHVVDEAAVNAFAAPGGYIVVFGGLIAKADRPEEVAGVLAHEIQHVEQRHSTTMLLREVSAGALLAAATGDATQLAQLLAAARVFGRLHFSREAEASADAGGMAMLRAARIDPTGMASFMRKMARDEGREPAPLAYLSTHPQTADRAEALDRMAKAADYAPITLLTDAEWEALRAICEGVEAAR